MAKRWTEEEDQILLDNYFNMTGKEIHKRFLLHRNRHAIQLRATQKLGLNNQVQVSWAKEEDEFLRENALKGITFAITGTYEVLSFVRDTIDSHFDYYSYHKKPSTVITYKDRNCSQYSVQGRRAMEILSYMSKLNTPCLERKWNKFWEDTHEKEI